MTPRAAVVALLAVLALGLPRLATAQSRATVFLHGFAAEASDWNGAADRLREDVAIKPYLPPLPWREKFETQAQALQSRSDIRGLPSNTIVVGHSNGGLVAREWSRMRTVGGIVTLGTPHRGAPILTNLPVWAAFSGTTRGMVGQVVFAFTRSSEWTWVLAVVNSALSFTADFSVWSLVNLTAVLGVQAVVPVTPQMLPTSSYLAALNGSGNLSREAGAVTNRVGIASVAKNFYYAGPARAILPQYADRIATAMYAAASTLLFWGNHILVNALPDDVAAIQQGLALIDLANQILAIDPVYCSMVSTLNLSGCVANDGLLPVTSQAYPGAPNLLIQGPAHRQEKQQSDDALYAALVNYMRVPRRTTSPPPSDPTPDAPPESDPEPEDPDPDDPEPDEDPVSIWTGELGPGDELRPGDTVHSTNGRVHLAYQGDGNLVLYVGDGDHGWTPLWASDTAGTAPGFVAMQGDGNLVVYDKSGRAQWDSGTFRSGSWLAVQNDGNLVIYDSNGTPLWATDTFVD